MTLLFIILWLSQPFLWFVLIKSSSKSIWKIDLFNSVLFFIILFQYLGLPILYFKLDKFRSIFVTNSAIVFEVFIYTSITILIMIFGKRIGVFYTKKYRHPVSNNPEVKAIPNRFSRIIIYVIASISIAVLTAYIKKIGFWNLAISAVLGFNDSISSKVARSAMGNSFEGSYQWFSLFMHDILRFCLFYFYYQYLTNKTKITTYSFKILLLAVTFSSLMATEKGPILELIISLFIVYSFYKKSGFISFKSALQVGAIGIISSVIMYIAFMGNTSLLSSIWSPFSRVLTGQIQPAYHYLEIFPDKIDYLNGRSFPNPKGIFPFENFQLTKEVARIINEQTEGVVGSMPTIYWGELFANFGVLGILIIPFFVGLGLEIFQQLILQLPKYLFVPLLTWSIIHFKALAGTSLSNFILDLELVTIIVIVYFFSRLKIQRSHVRI